jgi:hypothetical protein
MSIPARRGPAQVSMAWMHVMFGAVCLVLTVYAIASLNAANWERRLMTIGVLAYSTQLHARLAWGLRRGEPWTREGSMQAAIRLLAAFPFGTIIGTVVLTHAWADGHRTPRRKPQVPLIEAWPEPDRLRARAAEDRAAPESRE